MFKGRKAWICMTVLVLLLGIVTPLGALAESGVATATIEVETDLYTNHYWNFIANVYDIWALAEDGNNVTWSTIAGELEECQFQWSACEGVDVPFYQMDDYSASCGGEESSLKSMIGKNLIRCNISKNGRQVATLTWKLKGYVHAPTWASSDFEPSPQYIYFDAGEPVTIQLKGKLEIGGGESISYRFSKSELRNDGFYYWVEDLNEQPITTTSITFTPTAQDDRRMIVWEAATKGHENWGGYGPDYILLDNAKKPIKMPSLTKSEEFLILKAGESTILTLPVATAGDTSKELEYRWYMLDETTDDNLNAKKLIQTSGYPSLTVNAKEAGAGKAYFCKVGYKGSNESTFLDYGLFFHVYSENGEGTSGSDTNDVPKTGDGTPLMAMFILLGVALAGTIVLVGVRRRRSHS